MKQMVRTDDSAFKGVLLVLMILATVFSCYMMIVLSSIMTY